MTMGGWTGTGTRDSDSMTAFKRGLRGLHAITRRRNGGFLFFTTYAALFFVLFSLLIINSAALLLEKIMGNK